MNNDTIYLHWGFLNHRVQRAFALCLGVLHVAFGVYKLFWTEDYIMGVFILAMALYWFRSAYEYHQAGDKAAARIQTTDEGLLIKQSPKPTEKVSVFQWQYIEKVKIDHHNRQMTIVLSYESPHVNRRYFFWLRSLSQDKLQAFEQLLQPYLTSHEISLCTISATNQSARPKSA